MTGKGSCLALTRTLRNQDAEGKGNPRQCGDLYSGQKLVAGRTLEAQRRVPNDEDTLKGGAKKPELAKCLGRIAAVKNPG